MDLKRVMYMSTYSWREFYKFKVEMFRERARVCGDERVAKKYESKAEDARRMRVSLEFLSRPLVGSGTRMPGNPYWIM